MSAPAAAIAVDEISPSVSRIVAALPPLMALVALAVAAFAAIEASNVHTTLRAVATLDAAADVAKLTSDAAAASARGESLRRFHALAVDLLREGSSAAAGAADRIAAITASSASSSTDGELFDALLWAQAALTAAAGMEETDYDIWIDAMVAAETDAVGLLRADEPDAPLSTNPPGHVSAARLFRALGNDWDCRPYLHPLAGHRCDDDEAAAWAAALAETSTLALPAGKSSVRRSVTTARIAQHEDIAFGALAVAATAAATEARTALRRKATLAGIRLLLTAVMTIAAVAGTVYSARIVRRRARAAQLGLGADFVPSSSSSVGVALSREGFAALDVTCASLALLADPPPPPPGAAISERLAVVGPRLEAIYPYVPRYMFIRPSMAAAADEEWLLNITPSLLTYPQLTFVAVSIARLCSDLAAAAAESAADGSGVVSDEAIVTEAEAALSAVLATVIKCASHFGGCYAMANADVVVVTFAGEGAEDGFSSVDRACRASFAMLSAWEDEARWPLRIAMATGRGILGTQQYHVSRHAVALSPCVLEVLRLLPLAQLYQCSIITTAATAQQLSDAFLTRPVHVLPPADVSARCGRCSPVTACEVVCEAPSDDHPDRAAVLADQAVVRERVQAWSQLWAQYQAIITAPDRPPREAVEALGRDLEAYAIFRLAPGEHDPAQAALAQMLRRVEEELGTAVIDSTVRL